MASVKQGYTTEPRMNCYFHSHIWFISLTDTSEINHTASESSTGTQHVMTLKKCGKAMAIKSEEWFLP